MPLVSCSSFHSVFRRNKFSLPLCGYFRICISNVSNCNPFILQCIFNILGVMTYAMYVLRLLLVHKVWNYFNHKSLHYRWSRNIHWLFFPNSLCGLSQRCSCLLRSIQTSNTAQHSRYALQCWLLWIIFYFNMSEVPKDKLCLMLYCVIFFRSA